MLVEEASARKMQSGWRREQAVRRAMRLPMRPGVRARESGDEAGGWRSPGRGVPVPTCLGARLKLLPQG